MPRANRTVLFHTWLLAALWPMTVAAVSVIDKLSDPAHLGLKQPFLSYLRYEVGPNLPLVGLVGLLALPAGITHAVAMSRLKERRAPIVPASLLTFLIAGACWLAVLAAVWVTSLFINKYSQGWILDVIRTVGGLACYAIYILLPFRTVPLIESLVLHRALRRRLPKDGAPDVRCTECGTMCRVGMVGLSGRFRYRIHTIAAVLALLLVLLIGVPMARVLWGTATPVQPQATRSVSLLLTPDDIRGTTFGDKLDAQAATSSSWQPFALPQPGQLFNGKIVLSVHDYTYGYSMDHRSSGAIYHWIQWRAYQFYYDPVTKTGPLPYSHPYAPHLGWIGDDGWRIGDQWCPACLFRQTPTATGGKRVLLIDLLGLFASIGLAVAILHALLLAAWCWRRYGLNRWKRLERAAHVQCTECGYPLALPGPKAVENIPV